MKHFPYTKNGMKQVFEDCPHKGFAKKCVALIEGNVLDPAYHSGYIRTYSTVTNGNYSDPKWIPGYLQSYDLKSVDAPTPIRNYIQNEENRDKSFIVMHVYEFGWIAYASERTISELGERITTAKVLAQYIRTNRNKAHALFYWLKEVIETEERYMLDVHGWPKFTEEGERA